MQIFNGIPSMRVGVNGMRQHLTISHWSNPPEPPCKALEVRTAVLQSSGDPRTSLPYGDAAAAIELALARTMGTGKPKGLPIPLKKSNQQVPLYKITN